MTLNGLNRFAGTVGDGVFLYSTQVLVALTLVVSVITFVLSDYRVGTFEFWLLAGWFFSLSQLSLLSVAVKQSGSLTSILYSFILIAICVFYFAGHYYADGLRCLFEIENSEIPLLEIGCLNAQPMDFSDSVYFSVVTTTTLGYGDFQPSPGLRILASLQSVVGYCFLGAFVSFILSLEGAN